MYETWTVTGVSSANTAQTVTTAAATREQHFVTSFLVVIKGADAGEDIDIELKDDTTVIWRDVIGFGSGRGSRVGIVCEDKPFEITEGNAVNLVIGVGGAGCVTVASMKGYTRG